MDFSGQKKELQDLVKTGFNLYFALLDQVGVELPEEGREKLPKDLPVFSRDYEQWYSKALSIVSLVLPDRRSDFMSMYKSDRPRKSVDHENYTVRDAVIDLRVTRGATVVTDSVSAIPKLLIQVKILESCKDRFESSLYNLKETFLAALFDGELDSARSLNKNGFVRGAGAIAGVVLEGHLGESCSRHGIKIKKKNPTINDFNEQLKNEGVIETHTWRFIQHLGDIRNLCDHKKAREPKQDDITELIEGVDKIIKTVF